MAVDQPLLISPRTCETGTRTSVKNTSLKPESPDIMRNGRTVTPGARMSASRQVIPLCLAASKSVRTSSRHHSAICAKLVHIFWPLTMNASPSRTAFVPSEARSLPAFGSENPWHQISSPERIGAR